MELRRAKRIPPKQPNAPAQWVIQRTAAMLTKLYSNDRRLTVNAVITESLFSTGGTLAGHENYVRKAIKSFKKTKQSSCTHH